MEYRVLGSLQLRGCGATRWRPVVGRAQRRLLAVLLLHRDHIVGADALEEHLGLSGGAVRTTVSRLRHDIDDGSLRTIPPGYRIEACDVDASRFEQLVSHASRADVASAHRDLVEALSLWRDRAYDEFADEPWAIHEVARLTELRRVAVEDLAELVLDGGEPVDALALVEGLLEEDPYRDRARAILIRAHAESGRPIEALHAFREYQALLAEEIGVGPAPGVVALDRAIALALVVADGDPGPAIDAVEAIAATLAEGPGRPFAARLSAVVAEERRRRSMARLARSAGG